MAVQARAGDGRHAGTAATRALPAILDHIPHVGARLHTRPGRLLVRQDVPCPPLCAHP